MFSHGDLFTPNRCHVVLLILKGSLGWKFSGTTGYSPLLRDTLYRKAYWNIRFPSLPRNPTQATAGGGCFVCLSSEFLHANKWDTSRTATKNKPSSVIQKQCIYYPNNNHINSNWYFWFSAFLVIKRYWHDYALIQTHTCNNLLMRYFANFRMFSSYMCARNSEKCINFIFENQFVSLSGFNWLTQR